ncbi:MAG TPA: asparagine synthase (glutamine-hydrolyzing) [Longimicrobium sp.]|nr:asparagine synthase (glutamine-hydrolyzing) [Longimicrobium sp.]
MCGICGIYHFDRDRAAGQGELAAMAHALRHRGPDGEGFHHDGSLGLGHRRLSIIDLSESGRQPMTDEHGRYWITFNGEIYNYLELRQLLVGRGHVFRSHTDTEVILHLWEDEGPECLHRLNGMFAFAIWDSATRTLFAARDRFGVKPFYYAVAGGSFVFASEIKALFASGAVTPGLDRNGLADYLTFQFCLGDKTLFRGVRKLLPGHAMTVRADGRVEVRKYWDLDYTIDAGATDEAVQHQLLRLLEDAVRIQLRADVPVGAHLSGGLDSSTVSCVAASLLPGPLHTFTGGFRDGPQFDETRYAKTVAERTGAVYHEIFPGAADFVDVMPRLMHFMDEPVAGPGVFPQYFVSKLAKEHVKVVLGGQGGDEVFGGYTRYLIAYLEECIKGGIEGTQEDDKYVVTFESILPNLTELQGYQPLLKYLWQDGVFGPADLRYYRLIDRSAGLQGLVATEAFAGCDGYSPLEAYREVFAEGQCRSLINRMTRFDLKTLLPALLQVEDRTSMAVSLESRVPLLDHRIAELVASVPPRVKYNGGRSKHLFREVVKHVVPPEIFARRDKMGFPVPLTEWYGGGPVREFVRDTLLDGRARQRGLLKGDGVEALLSGERSYGRALWGLLSIELWMRAFFDGDVAG